MSAATAELEQLADVGLEHPTGDRPRCAARWTCTCPQREHGCDDPARWRVSWTSGSVRIVALLCAEHTELVVAHAPDAVRRPL